MRYGDNTKKIVFYDTDKRHADLKIKLQNDDISQNDFFRALVTAYIKGDRRVVEYLNEWRLENGKQSRAKIEISKKTMDKGEETKRKFALDDATVENIFDILEKHRPDL
jgi:hypothetical protein